VVGAEPLLSTKAQILVGNAGVCRRKDGRLGLNSASFGGVPLIKAVAPDLCDISLYINDAGASTASSTVQTNLQTLITACKLSGDVILETVPPSPTPPYTTLEALYYPVIAALAASDNIPEMDIYARFGSAWNSTFMNGSTTLHPNDQGYWVLGAGPTRSYST